MSKRHGAREQKKLAKQKAKADARRRQLARANSPDPTIRLAAADRWPVIASLVQENTWTDGIGHAIIARRTPQGLLAFGIFLVDVFCMGVKNTLWRVDGPDAYRHMVDQIEKRGKLKTVSPEYVSKLVHCAADYAQALDIKPHADFRHVRLLLEGIDPSKCPDAMEFGQNGKPYYIAGPNESPYRVRELIERVTAVGGHFLAPLAPSDLDALDLDAIELDARDLDELDADVLDVDALGGGNLEIADQSDDLRE